MGEEQKEYIKFNAKTYFVETNNDDCDGTTISLCMRNDEPLLSDITAADNNITSKSYHIAGHEFFIKPSTLDKMKKGVDNSYELITHPMY